MLDYQGFSAKSLNREIKASFETLKEELKWKGIKYIEFKNVLIPQKSKKEMAIVFNTNLIEDSWYGNYVFEQLLPLLCGIGNYSISTGDLIADNRHQE